MSIKHSSKEINDKYFEYDKNGNLLKSKGYSFHILVEIYLNQHKPVLGEKIADYVYNAQGKLIEQLVPNQGMLMTFYVQGDDTHLCQGDVHSKKIAANKHIFGRMLGQQNICQLELSISDFKGSQIEIFGPNKHEINTYSIYGVLGNKA